MGSRGCLICRAYSPLLFRGDLCPMPTLRSYIGWYLRGLWPNAGCVLLSNKSKDGVYLVKGLESEEELSVCEISRERLPLTERISQGLGPEPRRGPRCLR